jgi:endoglucanase
MDLLKRLSEAPGVPGYEAQVREITKEALDGLADDVRVDRLGNLIATVNGDGPAVVVAAHMDEIGFLVSHVEEKTGFLRIEPLGGFDPRTLVAQRVAVHTEAATLPGVMGIKPTHILTDEERKKPMQLKDLFVDIGLPAEEVREQVALGDMVTLHQDFTRFGRVVSGKSLDDRAGIYAAIEALRRVPSPRCRLAVVGTTQEEVGLRGARVAGFACRPDIAVALDVTVAVDLPKVADHEQVTRLGKGVAIKLKDSASISHPALVRHMRSLAEDRGIPYQMEILPRGGTDAGALQFAHEGAAVITLSLPVRYVHSVVETAHVDDLEAWIALLAAFLETADAVKLER